MTAFRSWDRLHDLIRSDGRYKQAKDSKNKNDYHSKYSKNGTITIITEAKT